MELATTAWMMLTDWQQVFEKLPQDLLLMLQIFPFASTLFLKPTLAINR